MSDNYLTWMGGGIYQGLRSIWKREPPTMFLLKLVSCALGMVLLTILLWTFLLPYISGWAPLVMLVNVLFWATYTTWLIKQQYKKEDEEQIDK